MRIWVASIFTFLFSFIIFVLISLLCYLIGSTVLLSVSHLEFVVHNCRIACEILAQEQTGAFYSIVFTEYSNHLQVKKNTIIFRVMLRCFLSRGYDPSDQPFGFFSFFFLFIFIFIFFYILYLHMYLHYTYFLHDAYTTLTCTTYNTYITIQLHQSN